MPSLGLSIWLTAIILAVAITAISLSMAASARRSRTERLQILFGPEYDRAIRLYGDKHRAETVLESRRQHLEDLGVHELSESEREEYLMDWATIQSAAPADAISTLIRADSLLTEILRAEGCPADDPEERKIDLALMHPAIAEEYRNASSVLDWQRSGMASREECRRAVIRYSNIFDSILGKADFTTGLKKVS